MGTEFQQFASAKCKFMDIVHSQEPDILKIHSLYVANLLCNRRSTEKQAIENASGATLRFRKVTTFKQASQLKKTKKKKKVIWGKTKYSALISGLLAKRSVSLGSPEAT